MTTARQSIFRYVYTMLLLGATSSAYGANFVNLSLTRVNDFLNPSNQFFTMIDVNIPDVAGVTGVTATLGGGSSLSLTSKGEGQWFDEESFATLADAKSVLDGTWTLDVVGSSPSSSSFSYSANSLMNEDFFATPSVTKPVNWATTVDRNTSFNWTDPTGPAAANVLVVSVEGEDDSFDQEDDSAFGSLNIASTSWSPPSPLVVGPTEFDVLYLKANATPAGDFSVNSGTITWGDSPFDPNFGGTANPLSAIGSQTIIGFDVIPGADFNLDGSVDGIDFLNWQRGYDPNCTNCTFAAGDADGDQDVDRDDLAVWELQYGTVASLSASSAAVPEPTTSALALAALCLAMSRRRSFLDGRPMWPAKLSGCLFTLDPQPQGGISQ